MRRSLAPAVPTPLTRVSPVDGKNIAELSLDTLRQGMTLIPQDPLLLEMSIRDNLDLEGGASDADIWSALEKSSVALFSLHERMKLTSLRFVDEGSHRGPPAQAGRGRFGLGAVLARPEAASCTCSGSPAQ